MEVERNLQKWSLSGESLSGKSIGSRVNKVVYIYISVCICIYLIVRDKLL